MSVGSLGSLLTLLFCGAGDVGELTDRAFQQAVALVSPAVVRIDTVGGRDALEPGLVAAGTTTGVVVSADGYVITSAFHFVSQPSSIIVTLPDERRLAGRQIATDRQRMLTLLKVDAERLPVPAATPREAIQVGQWSLAVGRTFDSELPSVSVGIVSALNRVWGKAIQTDAKVSPVNYGGPLVDIEGRVMGILAPLSPHESGDTAGVEWYDSGIGFAVPFADVLAVLDRLKQGKDLLPGQLGVSFPGKDLVSGEPLVASVRFDSPAEKAGIQKDDRITSVAGQPITRLAELKHVLGQKYAGETLNLEVTRGDKVLPISLELVGELPPWQPAFAGWQLSRDPSKPALTVRHVWTGSPAEKAGLKADDQLVRVNEDAVTSLEELRAAWTRIRPENEVALAIQRDNQPLTLKLKVTAAPATVPTELPAEVTFGSEPRPDNVTVGRQSETLAAHDRTLWWYAPENYHPDQPLSLVVFLHPSLNPMEQAVLTAWRAECERRGILLLAPRSEAATGWSPNDREFLKDCVTHIQGKYSIADDRIAVIGFGNSAPLAAGWSFQPGEGIDGLILIDSAPLGKVPENSPERRLQLYTLPRGQNVDAVKWKQAAESLRRLGFPTVSGTATGEPGQYPSAEGNAELARWVDSLDRF